MFNTNLKFRGYSLLAFRSDIFAALIVVIILIPQGMAYALLAGLPPVYGLYASFIPLLIYPILGSSPYVSIGPVAIISVLLMSGLSQFAEPFSEDFIQKAMLVALLAGLIQIGLAFFKLGFLVNFISHPVISGFTSAAAIIIIVSQLKYFFGLDIKGGSTVIISLRELISNLSSLNPLAVAISSGSIFLIVLMKKIKRSFPTALILIVVSSLAVCYLGLGQELKVIGKVTSGLPSFSLPAFWKVNTVLTLLPLSIIIAVISFVESLAIVKSLGAKHGQYLFGPNRELASLGLAKVLGSIFQAYPNSASFSRSAINEDSGAKTGWSSIFAAVFVGISLFAFTDLFYHIPYAVLSAIVITAVFNLINLKEAKQLFANDRSDFVIMLSTFIGTLFLGVQIGLTIGVLLSMVWLIHELSQPHVAILGEIEGQGVYKNVKRFESAKVKRDTLIIRYDDNIFFGNAEHFILSVNNAIQAKPMTKTLILDMSSISNIDSTGVGHFKLLIEILDEKNIDFHISGPKGPLRDRLKKEGIFKLLGEDHLHMTIEKTMSHMSIHN